MVPLHLEAQQRFSIALPEGEAVLDYQLQNGAVDFTHTFVPPELRGKGLAEILVRAGLDWARQNRLSVEASCSYVALFLKRNPTLANQRPN